MRRQSIFSLGDTQRVVLLGLAVLGLALSACQKKSAIKEYSRPLPVGSDALVKITDPAEIPYFGADTGNKALLLESLNQSLIYFNAPSSRNHYPMARITHDRAMRSVTRFKEMIEQGLWGSALDAAIKREFDVYMSVGWDGSGEVLFTGYCEPVYQGSRTPSARFRYPLYKLPPDLVKAADGTPLGRRTAEGPIVPYWNRQQIEEGEKLKNKGLELVYLEDAFEAFIVHIQGSARIILQNGDEFRIGYAGKTQHAYQSISMALVRDGKLKKDQLSLRSMKIFFRKHPDELKHYLYLNPCYVFFRPTIGGPYGSLGVAVSARRSIATDKHIFPRGSLSFLQAQIPLDGLSATQRMVGFNDFVLDQDTGGAIRSAGRCDIFLGTGLEAEAIAGAVRSEGRLYYLFLKH